MTRTITKSKWRVVGRNRIHWQVRLEFKPADLWVGVFSRRGGEREVWVCLLPMLPIHITWFKEWA